ncbi:MAG: hypothetical protein KDD12_01915 [Lewinella sp.]|nr:hypothetical protein [Lewinella sp.]
MKKNLYFCFFICLGLMSCQKESFNPDPSQTSSTAVNSTLAKVVVTVTENGESGSATCGSGGCSSGCNTGAAKQNNVAYADVALYKNASATESSDELSRAASGNTGEYGQAVFLDLEPVEYLVVVQTRMGEKSATVKTAAGNTAYVNIDF